MIKPHTRLAIYLVRDQYDQLASLDQPVDYALLEDVCAHLGVDSTQRVV